MAGSDALAPASGSGSALATASSSVAQGSADIEANRAGMKSALTDYAADKSRIDAKEAALGDAPRLDALPKAPERQASNPIEAFGSAAMVLSVLGSTLTRQHLTAALNGATGVIGAYKQHDAEAADQKFQEWKVNTDNALKLHQYAMDTYKTSLDKLRDDRTGATAELNAKFKAFGDDNAAAVLQEQGAEGLSKLFLERDRQAADIGLRAQELGDKHKQVQQLFDLQADLKKGRELAASGDPAGAEAVRKAQQGIQDWATTQPGGIRAAAPNTPLAKFIQLRSEEAAASGEAWTADKEKAAVAEFNKDTAKPAASSNIKAAELQAWTREQTAVNGRPPSAAELEDHRKEMDQAKPTISKESATRRAEQVLAGDATAAAQGMGRGNAATANYALVDDEVTRLSQERSISGADLAAKQAEFRGLGAAERALGTKSATVGMALNEAKNLVPVAVTASEAVDRSKYPTLNAALLAADRGTGDENVIRLAGATNSLINAYSRAISPTGVPTDSDKSHAREILDAAFSKGQYKAAVDQLMIEMNAAEKSPGQTKTQLREGFTGQQQPAGAAPAAGGAPKQISTQQEYDALPSGAVYISTDGKPHRKP